jgi:TfoX/Sxy family transcriptional regulator of competence genes
MVRDPILVERLRELLAGEDDVTEKQMFGGLAFLVAGHLAVSASSRGGLLLRVDPADRERLEVDERVSPFVMRGREMSGWLHVDVDASVSDEELERWVRHGVGYARSLPPK